MTGSQKLVRSVGTVALLLVLAGQAALLAHAVKADHQPGEVCEICIGADRLSDGLITASPSVESTTYSGFAAPYSTAPGDQRSAWAFRPRGPPQI